MRNIVNETTSTGSEPQDSRAITSCSSDYYPIYSYQFILGIYNNPQKIVEFTALGGTIAAGAANNGVDISCSTTSFSYGVIRSKTLLRATPFTSVSIFDMKYDTPVNNSLQFAGMGSATDDLYFCYNNEEFSIRTSYGGSLEILELEITAAASGAETATITLNSVEFTASLTNASGAISFTAHEVEIGPAGGTGYTGWTVQHIGAKVVFVAGSVGDRSGGTYSFSSTGTAAGTFTSLSTGSALTTVYVPQSEWNGDSAMKRHVNPLKINRYMIQYSNDISTRRFMIFNPVSSVFEEIHRTVNSNKVDSIQLSTNNLFFQAGVYNIGSNTAQTVSCYNIDFGYQGTPRRALDIKTSISSSQAIASSTSTVILAIQNRLHVNGVSNASETYVKSLSVAADGNRPVRLRLLLNPTTLSADTTSDYTNFTYADESYSTLIYDETSVTFSGGSLLFELILGKDQSTFINLLEFNIVLAREDTIILTALSSATNTIDASINFLEETT